MNKRKAVLLVLATLLALFLIFCILYRVKIKNYISQKFEKFTDKYTFEDKEDLEIQVPVLMYHYLGGYGTDVSKSEDKNMISADALEKQMQWLYENGYESLTMKEFMCWKNGDCEIDDNRFLLTFDDGFTSTYFIAEPILKKYNFTAIQFVINELINDKTPAYNEQPYAYVGYDYIDEYSREVIEIGSHTYEMHHQVPKVYAKVNGMTYEDILEDFERSKEELNTKYISYPYGAITQDEKKAAKDAGYDCGFAIKGTMTYATEDNYEISRISATEDFEKFKSIFETDLFRKKTLKLF